MKKGNSGGLGRPRKKKKIREKKQQQCWKPCGGVRAGEAGGRGLLVTEKTKKKKKGKEGGGGNTFTWAGSTTRWFVEKNRTPRRTNTTLP